MFIFEKTYLMQLLRILLLCLVIFQFSNSTDAQQKRKPPVYNSVLLNKMTQAIKSDEFPNIHSVLILKNDQLIYEQYFPGEDEIWGNKIGFVNHTADSLHDLRSISKSIVSACIGIAIRAGMIKSVDQRIFEFFPQYEKLDTGIRSQLTIRHLLTMSSGIKWNEDVPYDSPENSEIAMALSRDPVEYVLSQPLIHPPGQFWQYNGGTTQVLAAILQKVSGLQVDGFAAKYLYTPLGILTYSWTKYPGIDMPAAASGVRLRPRDMAIFGQLYMHDGTYRSARILDENWVKESFKSQVPRGKDGGYGFQFWIFQDSVNHRPREIIAAVGNGDQRIFFDKENKLLVVITAGNYNKWNLPKSSQNLMRDYIYPSVVGKGKY
jgi:CubicO group peptidase (beta-lactamase class C family)